MSEDEGARDGIQDFFSKQPFLARILQMVLQEFVRILRESQKEDKS